MRNKNGESMGLKFSLNEKEKKFCVSLARKSIEYFFDSGMPLKIPEKEIPGLRVVMSAPDSMPYVSVRAARPVNCFPYSSSRLMTATAGGAPPVPSNKRRFAAKYSSNVL